MGVALDVSDDVEAALGRLVDAVANVCQPTVVSARIAASRDFGIS